MGNARRSGLRPNHAPKGDGGGDGDDDDEHGDDEQHASDDDGGHCVMLSSVLFSRRRQKAHQAHSGNQRLRAVLRGALDKPERVCNGGQLRQDIEPCPGSATSPEGAQLSCPSFSKMTSSNLKSVKWKNRCPTRKTTTGLNV